MFKSRTVFIIGAGASAELGLPIGAGLKLKIAEALSTDPQSYVQFRDTAISEAMTMYAQSTDGDDRIYDRHEVVAIASRIAMNMPIAPSIDNFINSHRDERHLVAISKIAIARCILSAERDSLLYEKRHGQYYLPRTDENFLQAWHIALWQHLNADITKLDVDKIFSNVSFIVFNYDRCLEHFLYLCLRSYYDLSEKRAAEILSKATIIHPYGQVGGLPYSKETVIAEYGADDPAILLDISSQIRTFMESIHEGVANDMKEVIRNAETLVSLGFGFIDQNIRLLQTQSSITRAIMTAYKTSDSDIQMAADKIGNMIGRRPKTGASGYREQTEFESHIVKGPCNSLFAAHYLRLPERAP